MNVEKRKEFELWWNSRKHTRAKIKGTSLSNQTLYCYLNILKKLPDIKIDENTDPDDVTLSIRRCLKENVGENKIFKTVYPQLIFAIRTYIKMYEDYPSPKINRIAKTIRLSIKAPIYKDIKGTQQLFTEKFLTKKEIRYLIDI